MQRRECRISLTAWILCAWGELLSSEAHWTTFLSKSSCDFPRLASTPDPVSTFQFSQVETSITAVWLLPWLNRRAYFSTAVVDWILLQRQCCQLASRNSVVCQEMLGSSLECQPQVDHSPGLVSCVLWVSYFGASCTPGSALLALAHVFPTSSPTSTSVLLKLQHTSCLRLQLSNPEAHGVIGIYTVNNPTAPIWGGQQCFSFDNALCLSVAWLRNVWGYLGDQRCPCSI